MRKLQFFTLCFCLAVFAANAQEPWRDPHKNWNQWRGPLGTGFAPFGHPPTKWDDKTNIRWKAEIPGKGSATPIIWGERVFVLTAVKTDRVADAGSLPKVDPKFEVKTKAPTNYYQFLVLCFDRETGKERWRQVATEQVPHEGMHPSHSYAAGSPVTDGRFLYASFGSRGIYCYDLDGKLQWKRDLGLMHTRLGWGEGTSPALHGDTLVVNWDQEADSYIVALDARTGKTRWKKDRDEKTSWATPLIVEHKGRAQVIISATNFVRSYDLSTGDLIWQCAGQTVNVIPSPVLYGDHVICMSGYRGYMACAVPLDSKGDVTTSAKFLWKYDKGTPYVPSPLLVGDRLYFTQQNNPLLTCLDVKTGKPLIDRERLPGIDSFYASPVAAGGHIYLVGRDGTTLVIKQTDKLEILSTNKLNDPIDASPAIVGGQLYLRGEKYLYCIE